MNAAVDLEVVVPPGYHALPLIDIEAQLDRAVEVLSPLTPAEAVKNLDAVVGALRASLQEMRGGGVRYCGIGRHWLSDADEQVSSWLTVNVQEFGPARNPHLALDEFLRRIPNDSGQVSDGVTTEVVDGRPIAYYVNLADGGSYCQLRGVVPSADGATFAVVELSSSAVEHGARFRGVVMGVARSLRFVAARSDALCW
ncbi:hypothetical protein [Tomitella biformata]|uniref:hypothetical protein n=1 Tax=Tomitella biformata TaxID=630403 RepID=UPI0004662986|nr:hypothetical protein [Tomitella biformata]